MIKEIGEKDFAPFFELMAFVECGTHFDHSNPTHITWLKKRISCYFMRGTRFFAYYLKDGSPVGFAALLIEDGPENVSCLGQKSDLVDIAVFEKHRKSGFGAKLLKYAEDFSRKKGVYCMYLSTYAKNCDALTFYIKNGFTPVATLPDVYGPNDEGEIHLRKILT